MDPFANQLIGYTASGTTIVAYGLQFFHILRCGTVEGISLPRTLLDTASLALWVLYATRIEDIPLLIATSCELLVSLCVASIILRHRCCPPQLVVKDWIPPKAQSTEVCVIYVNPQPPF
jgi:uncharacterized protein with PQ loop repeat